MVRIARWALPVAVVIAGTVTLAQQSKTLPKPFETESVRNRSRVIPRPPDAQLKVPAGFTVDVWADGFAKPRFMIEGSRGEVIVADSGSDPAAGAPPPKNGAVYIVGPGAKAAKKTLVEHLDRPYGLALWKNYLYVAEPESVKRYTYDAAAAKAGPAEEVISLTGFGSGHWTRSLLFDRAATKLYVGVGSASNVDPGEDPRRAAINRYNPDGSGHETFASGTRNPIGLHWYPGTDTLWAAVQERDGLGDDLPSDYFTQIQPRAFYGWPYAYLGPNEDPRLKDKAPDLVKKTLAPDVLLGAHVAVLDFAFYSGDKFPAEYRGGAFIALHGSWNRAKRTGYSIVFQPFKNGRPAGDPKDFLSGWMISPDSADVWGRPVAVLELRDGSLLVSDDGGNKIWRVKYGS